MNRVIRRELVDVLLFFACLFKTGCYTGLILVPAGLLLYRFRKFIHKGDRRYVVPKALDRWN